MNHPQRSLDEVRASLTETRAAIAALEECCAFLAHATAECWDKYPELSEGCERRRIGLQNRLSALREVERLLALDFEQATLRAKLGRSGRSFQNPHGLRVVKLFKDPSDWSGK